MLILGYLAMFALGLLPLAAFARLAGVEADRTFFLPTEVALVVAFAIGLAVCLLVGRVLGLLHFQDLHSYEQRVVVRTDGGIIRRRRRMANPSIRRRDDVTRAARGVR